LKYCKLILNHIIAIRTNEELYQSLLKCSICCHYCKEYDICDGKCNKVLCDEKISYKEATILII